ncbi:hypothetical protein H072_2340 [Dactylellina haptotyla CBS 200.50]|uniref:Wax synthase domain-containing protein n=1 Tax=Dactylellina haptotyla (strain CBS 200.50) TaxID=1284197 RepID=S8AKZ5_DACHA|nr:hypothetical protein H072_2340 [Dactylellina haptotyla CBS 200.50]
MALFPPSAIEPFALFPARQEILSSRTPLLLHEALLPVFLLILTLLISPYKSHTRNAVTLPVILALYTRLSYLYSSSHWGIAFCVGAYTYFGSLQAFNLLVVKDVGRDADVRWVVDDTGFTRGVKHNNGHTNGDIARREKYTNGYTNVNVEKAVVSNGSTSPSANGSANGNANGYSNGHANGHTNGTANGRVDAKPGLGYPELSKYPLYQRIRFTVSLIASSRGVGWKFQVRQIRPAPAPSSTLLAFMKTHFTHILITYVILDHFGYHISIDPYFTKSDCWKSPFHTSPLSPDDWRDQCLPSFVPRTSTAAFIYHHIFRKHLTLISVYAILTQLFSIAAILFTVPIPITGPSSWAPLFGPVSQATSLRGFWTSCWHSIFKKGFSYPGEWLAFRVLGLDRRNVWAQVIVVLAAFINSGGLHGLGCWTQNGRGIAAAGFFFLQPFGFLGEAAVFKLLKVANVDRKSGLGTFLTTSWMMAWGLWSCDVFFYDFLHGGVGGSEPVAWSAWRWWVGEQAYRWAPPGEWMRWDSEGSLWGWGVRV